MNSPKQPGTSKATINISGMSCTSCAQRLEKKLQETRGVTSALVNFAAEKAYISYLTHQVTRKELINAVKEAGFEGEIYRENQRTANIKISGMSCSACAQRIEKNLQKLEGVQDASVNLASHQARVTYEPDVLEIKKVLQAVEKSGFQAEEEPGREELKQDEEDWKLQQAAKKMWLGVSFALPIMILMMIHMFIIEIPYYFTIVVILGFPPIFIAGGETHRGSYRALKNLTPNMDTLVTLGSLVPYGLNFLGFWLPITSFVEMAASIITLHLVGRFLETRAKGRASQAIKKLLEMEAKTARILVNGEEKEVPLEEVKEGDIMLVRPGEKIPTDAVVTEGESTIDESMATGESFPVERKQGDEVIGATINKQGLLKVKATRVGKDTFLSQVVKMVEECQGSKVPIQEFADRITGYFVPGVLIISVMAFSSWMWFPEFHAGVVEFFSFPWSDTGLPQISLAILATIAVLVISCPCALGLATPTAIMVGSGLGAEKGILLRKGEAIQTIKETSIVAFDKTGTLTRGTPEVTDIKSMGDFNTPDLLFYAASLEKASEHPLAGAIVNKARQEGIDPTNPGEFKAITGKGVEGRVNDIKVIIGNRNLMLERKIDLPEGEKLQETLESQAKTVMLVAVEGKLAGLLAVADPLKEDAPQALQELKRMGMETAMITGDNWRTAEAIAHQAGVNRVLAEVLPEGKVKEIKKLQEEYGNVAMVGDGINDAPALTQANTGIALGTGTDIAIEAAEITLVRGDLSSVISAIKLSLATFGKIRQNYFWAWFYNGIAIPAAFMGLIHPIIGAAAMAASSLNVVLNSLRLKKVNLD